MLAATYDDYELLIADHSSTDGTGGSCSVMRTTQGALLTTPAGGGAIANWTAVTDQAQGEYLEASVRGRPDLPTCLERQVAATAAQRGTGALPSAISSTPPAIRATWLQAARQDASGRAGAPWLPVLGGDDMLGEPGTLRPAAAPCRLAAGTAATRSRIDQNPPADVSAGPAPPSPWTTPAAFRLSQEQWSVRVIKLQASRCSPSTIASIRSTRAC